MGDTGLAILIIAGLTAGATFFSASAMALQAFSRTRLQDAFKKNHSDSAAAALTEQLSRNAHSLSLACGFYVLATGAGIVLVLIGSFGGFGRSSLHTGDYLLSFAIAVGLLSIFGLAVPYAWARYAGEKLLSRTHILLRLLHRPVWPVLRVLAACEALVRRLAGVPPTTPDQRQDQKQEEFLDGLEQRRIEGVVDEEEQEMIENVLELSDTTAGEIMTPRTDVVAVEANSDLKTVVETITGAGHTRVPVYEENIDNIIGLIYAKDLLAEIGKPPEDFKLRDKIRQAYFVPETKPLRVLLHEFQTQKLHIAIVLDEYGGTAGIVTLEDILEELVGEITDEYEKTPPEPVNRIDEHTFDVDARTHVDDLNDKFELDLPEDEDYETVGGFVFSHLGYIPRTGESFDYRDLRFTITSAGPRSIKRIRIQKIQQCQA